MFKRVMIANRGEIAVRIIRTLREMGITSIAVPSDADRDALFAQLADETYRLGPAPAAESYLSVRALLEVAREARVDAIHPGYGFLAENGAFAEAVAAAGMTFIGPSPEALRTMGDKVEARRAVAGLGVPLVPGSDGPVGTLAAAQDAAARIGYPIAVKAAGGGGGRGIRLVWEERELAAALEVARREASAYFNNPDVYLERYFPNPRHVEIQVLGDLRGHLVHLGERDCSVQRRHQKLIEESPSPAVDRALRARMGEAALRAGSSVDYSSAGTVEFLLTQEGEFYFLEMNTRIQVEHPVTELVTGLDLIREMVLAAAGEPISPSGDILDPLGHAIEVRVNAEDPRHGFRPTPTAITAYREPGGFGVRIDSGVYTGFTIPGLYDSLMSKVIAWGSDREASRRRLVRALGEYRITGPASTIPLGVCVLEHPAFVGGQITTTFLEDHANELLPPDVGSEEAPDGDAPMPARGEPRRFEVEVNRRVYRVQVAELVPDSSSRRASRPRPARSSDDSGAALVSPMHGTIVAVRKGPGEEVREGESLFVIEAMKMENEVVSHRTGRIATVDVAVGETVEAEQRLAVVE